MPLLNALLIWAVLGQAATPPAGQNGADLARDAAVILEARCFVCHGSGQQMHGLRLDRRENRKKKTIKI
jgi:mono/diheme cytochrome c family protein